jgi:hypothetical protein
MGLNNLYLWLGYASIQKAIIIKAIQFLDYLKEQGA